MTFNISTAVCAAKLLQKKGFSITEDSIKQGVADVKWSGRFEKISEKPLFIIDGAHNFSAVEALKKAIPMLKAQGYEFRRIEEKYETAGRSEIS